MSDPFRVLTQDTEDAMGALARKMVAACGRTDGACTHEVNGVELVADPAGVAWWEATGTLLVADLHLEKGSSLARRGAMVPPYDTQITLDRLAEAVERLRPRRVVALGDSFHDAHGAERLTLPARQRIAALQRGRDWVWITGNHDPEPPAGLPGDVADEVREGGLTLRHEPRVGAEPGEIAGHLHPKAGIVAGGRHIARPCFAADARRMILPSFGAYTGGLSVFHRAFAGLFQGRRFTALMLGRGQVFRLPGSKLV